MGVVHNIQSANLTPWNSLRLSSRTANVACDVSNKTALAAAADASSTDAQ